MHQPFRCLGVLVGVFAVIAAAPACDGDGDDGRPASGGAVVVFAAASLTDAFTEVGEAFSREYPDFDLTFNFAASSELVAQINHGAPADVYAAADVANMGRLLEAGNNAGAPNVFATNALAIVVEPGNPLNIESVADLDDPDLVVVTCDPAVPIGAYTSEVFDNAGVALEPASYEADVRAVVNKVVVGEADAGLVYATDTAAAGDAADGVQIPRDINVVAEYPIARLADAPNPEGAAAFAEFVMSDEAQQTLQAHGFSPP